MLRGLQTFKHSGARITYTHMPPMIRQGSTKVPPLYWWMRGSSQPLGQIVNGKRILLLFTSPEKALKYRDVHRFGHEWYRFGKDRAESLLQWLDSLTLQFDFAAIDPPTEPGTQFYSYTLEELKAKIRREAGWG